MSLGLTIRLLASPPTTRQHFELPVLTNWAPIDRAYMKPAQAACTSKAPQRRPSRFCNMQAIDGNDMSGREGSDDHHVDVAGIDAGVIDGPQDRLIAEVAGRHVGGGVTAFSDSRPLDDPLAVETEPFFKIVVGDDRVGNVTPGASTRKPVSFIVRAMPAFGRLTVVGVSVGVSNIITQVH